ncbi:MAG: polyphosphate kinase [Anaerolineaceae bacterium]|nr:polyphosphate kinase [Anaerolineaceae bacterium]
MDKYRVKQGQTINLEDWDANEISLFPEGKKAAKDKTKKLNKKLEALQELLYAEHKQKVLVVLQALDTGGKDGTIRAVFEGVNPAGVKVASFKVPTAIESDHDFLWRIHQHTPGKGEIVIFNRSHYEDVLVVRVHNLVDKDIWKKRYDHINNFEKMLTDEGATIIKIFLHISKDEQKERLQERWDVPEKNWKFSSGDLKERALWDEYQKAYEDVLEKTSTDYAPWYIIPANRNWYRNYLISSILVKKLESLNMEYPLPEDGLDNIEIE